MAPAKRVPRSGESDNNSLKCEASSRAATPARLSKVPKKKRQSRPSVSTVLTAEELNTKDFSSTKPCLLDEILEQMQDLQKPKEVEPHPYSKPVPFEKILRQYKLSMYQKRFDDMAKEEILRQQQQQKQKEQDKEHANRNIRKRLAKLIGTGGVNGWMPWGQPVISYILHDMRVPPPPPPGSSVARPSSPASSSSAVAPTSPSALPM